MSITDTDKSKLHNYPIHPLLQKRWSPRAFADRPVEPELLNQLFEAARWAPSSYNEQPWRFIFAHKKDKQAFNTLTQVLTEFNKEWATKAPVMVLAVTKKDFEQNNKRNRHAGHDLGQALSHLTFEAGRHDLFVHQMAGIIPEKARELFDISQDFEPLTMLTIGYVGEPNLLPEKLQELETAPPKRKPLDEIIFDGEWQE